MKKTTLFIPIMILLAFSLSACGSSVERTLDNGNQAFGEQAYEQALETYAQAIEMAPTLAEPVYNLANTLYRMEAFEQTGQLMGQALQLGSEELTQHGFYNLGNNFFQQQQMDGAIESYKESLRLNPDDLDAKYNLELAMQQQQEQEQEEQEQEEQEQEQQQDQNQSSEDQQEGDQSGEEQQDQNGGQDPQDQDQDGQEQQEDQSQSGEDQQQGDQNQNGEQSPEQQEQNAQGQPQQLEGLTEEQARQILAAIGQTTETLQEKLQEIFGVPIAPSGKDW